MIPGTIGVAAFQINVVIVQNLGLVIGGVDKPVIAPFNYAVRLLELPQGVFGISLATFLLPTLAGLATEKKYDDFRATLRQGMSHLLLLNLLAAVLLVVLAEPVVRLLFERGKFTPDATARTAFALECLGLSLIGYSLVNVLARAFYALGDTTTPMKVSLVCLVLNLAVAVALVFPLRQGGLGLANTASATLNCLLLLYALRRKLKRLDLAPLRASLLPMLAAAVLAGGLAWGATLGWEHWLGHAALPEKLGGVFVPALLAAAGYAAVVLAARVPSAVEMRDLALRRVRRSHTGGI
jgi:putative peptidoglycan lipid II flippase